MNKEQAINIAKTELQDEVITNVIEYEKVFAICFVNKEYAMSQKMQDLLIGNGPLLIEKTTGKIFKTGSALPLSMLIEAFNKYGCPYISYTNIVKLIIEENHIESKYDILLIKKIFSLPLFKAKQNYDQLLKDKSVNIELKNIDEVNEVLIKFQHKTIKIEQICIPKYLNSNLSIPADQIIQNDSL